MLVIFFRAVGMLLIFVGSFVIIADTQLLVDSRPESTVLWGLMLIGRFTQEPAWMAAVMWVLPVVIGAIMLITPRRVSISGFRRGR